MSESFLPNLISLFPLLCLLSIRPLPFIFFQIVQLLSRNDGHPPIPSRPGERRRRRGEEQWEGEREGGGDL